MPNRVIREGFLDSEKINSLPEREQNFFIRLSLVADDFGKYDARPGFLRSRCYPMSDICQTDVSKMLTKLKNTGLITLYEVEKKPYLQILNFGQRTRIMKSKYPDPVECQTDVRQTSDICRPETKPIQSKPNQSETESETKPKPIQSKEATWRDSFEEYKKIVDEAYKKLLNDDEEIKRQEEFYPNVDIKLSLKKAYTNFWITEAGWKNKKSKKSKDINMRRTFINNIERNRVFIDRDTRGPALSVKERLEIADGKKK